MARWPWTAMGNETQDRNSRLRSSAQDYCPGCALRKILVAKRRQWAQRYCTENLVAQKSKITLSQETREKLVAKENTRTDRNRQHGLSGAILPEAIRLEGMARQFAVARWRPESRAKRRSMEHFGMVSTSMGHGPREFYL